MNSYNIRLSRIQLKVMNENTRLELKYIIGCVGGVCGVLGVLAFLIHITSNEIVRDLLIGMSAPIIGILFSFVGYTTYLGVRGLVEWRRSTANFRDLQEWRARLEVL